MQFGPRSVRAKMGEHGLGRAHKEIRVFEKTQNTQIDNDGKRHTETSPRTTIETQKTKTGGITHQCRKRHQKTKLPIPPAVKKIARDREPDIAMRFGPKALEDEPRHRQEGVEENEAVKQHPSGESGY